MVETFVKFLVASLLIGAGMYLAGNVISTALLPVFKPLIKGTMIAFV